MHAPLDYDAGNETEALGLEAGDITYAALLDRHAAEEPITDEMIRLACLRMESAQAWPFTTAEREGASWTLSRLFRGRR